MPGKRAAPRRVQQGRAAGRTWAHGSSQPSQRSLPAGRSADLGFATAAGCRWITDAYHAVYVGAPLHYYELTSISKTHKGWRRGSVLKKGDVSIA